MPPLRQRALDKATTIQLDGQPLLAHAKVRRQHKGKQVLILMADLDVRVIDRDGVMIRHPRASSVGLPRDVPDYRLKSRCPTTSTT